MCVAHIHGHHDLMAATHTTVHPSTLRTSPGNPRSSSSDPLSFPIVPPFLPLKNELARSRCGCVCHRRCRDLRSPRCWRSCPGGPPSTTASSSSHRSSGAAPQRRHRPAPPTSTAAISPSYREFRPSPNPRAHPRPPRSEPSSGFPYFPPSNHRRRPPSPP